MRLKLFRRSSDIFDDDSAAQLLLDPLIIRLLSTSRAHGMRLTVTSRIPANSGDSKILDGVLDEDSADDVIRRTCLAMGRDCEPRMYLKLESGVEIGGEDKIGDYIKR